MSSTPTYGFQGRLAAEFPSQIIVDATEICNLECIHCPHPDFKRSAHFGSRSLPRELHDKMVEEVRTHGRGHTQYIRYTSNGEPLIHSGIYDMLDHAVQNSGVFITLTTNGTILNAPRVEGLLRSGLHLIDVSIDAVKAETYSLIRRKGRLDVTQSNVQRLIAMRNETRARTRIVVSFVEQPQNSEEAADFERFWTEQGADRVVIRRLHSAAGGVKGIADRLKHQHAAEARRPCLYPWERILLNPAGQLAFCPQDWVHGSVLADYRETTIRETWTSDGYRRLREAHLANNFSCHGFCGQCPDWASTRWPGQGLSYADMVGSFQAEP
ncbi:MAG TPA: radical SAM protein [Opitutaceae bacterium]|nr:radical SAM protein [Opitutaceae bacterium]